jgi:hypothetical protein
LPFDKDVAKIAGGGASRLEFQLRQIVVQQAVKNVRLVAAESQVHNGPLTFTVLIPRGHFNSARPWPFN